MINVNTLKPGVTFQVKADLFVVLATQHSQQGRGQANVKAKVKNLRTGTTVVMTFPGGSKVELAHIAKPEVTFLYAVGNAIVVMDQTSYEQFEIPRAKVQWELNFLREGATIKARMFGGELLDVELPAKVALKVTSAPDAVRGNTQSNPQKRVQTETGFELETPMFIKPGDTIIVATTDGKYVGKGR